MYTELIKQIAPEGSGVNKQVGCDWWTAGHDAHLLLDSVILTIITGLSCLYWKFMSDTDSRPGPGGRAGGGAGDGARGRSRKPELQHRDHLLMMLEK